MINRKSSHESVSFENPAVTGRVSIVIVCYNELKSLKRLIPTIREQTYDDIEIIGVMNGDDAGSKEYLKNHSVKVFTPNENLWYSGGNNYGVARATGEYILVLNADTKLKPECVEHLVEDADSSSESGVLVPKVLCDDEDSIDSFGMKFTKGGWYTNIGQNEPATRYDDQLQVSAFDGAAFMIKRAAVEEVGLFDRRFEFLQETVDLSLRLFRAGWKIHTVPDASVIHEGGGSFEDNKRSEADHYYGTRNDLFMIGKQYNWLFLSIILPIHLYWPIKRIFMGLISNNFIYINSEFRGLVEGLALLSANLRNTDRLSLWEQYEILQLPREKL